MTITRDQVLSFVYSQALIWLPLLAGHRLRHAGWLRQEISRPLQRFNLIVLCTAVYGLGIWRLEPGQGSWRRVMGVMALWLIAATLIGLWMGRRLSPDRRIAGTMAIMLPLSNNGHTLAGFLTIILYDTLAYAYNAVLMIPMIFFVILVWLPMGRHLADGAERSFLRNMRRVVLSAEGMPLLGVLGGILLKWQGPSMNDFWNEMLRWTVFGSTALTMFALGSRMYFRRMSGYGHLLKWVCWMKFLAWPLLMAGLCLSAGLSGPAAGALLIASCMPVGVMVVAVATLYDLDIDLANAGFIFSTLFFMLLVLPVLIWIVHWPFFR